jgi:hypothetical protein
VCLRDRWGSLLLVGHQARRGHVISDGPIVGKEAHEGWGERFSISGAFNGAATGGPLLNERGEVLGLLGGALPENLVRFVINDSQSNGSGGGRSR